MSNRITKYFIALLTLVFLPMRAEILAQDMATDDPEGAMTFLEGLSEETLAVWSDSTMNEQERNQAFKALFEKASDLELIGKAMLGVNYRRATQDQRSRYLEAVQLFIIHELDKNMSQIGFEKLTVIGTTPAPGKSGHLYVRTEIRRKEGDPIKADWRIRKKNDIFQIVNLEVEGINLIITNRGIFASRVKELGMDGFIEELKDKNKANAAALSE